ncbi:MAG: hypothetical protein RRA94_08890 [Bacteroidota bacterium]|nr:hypothetical protein [Bacteroidota bacterium]
MNIVPEHRFHIPVLGIGYSVDAPIKVAHLGISSVMSLVDDSLMEELRRHYMELDGLPYTPIAANEEDSRARRITAYLNMVQRLVRERFQALRTASFEQDAELRRYFELLPDSSPLRQRYREMLTSTDETRKRELQQWLRENMVTGAIDVNIMTKLDRAHYGPGNTALPAEYNDAHAALRGFAQSDLESSVVFSAGMNPRLYGYIANFEDFFPDAQGKLRKRITIKVSDFRSALIQGKYLAKRGLWVSEFRIESGLNCGGHAFATDGLLMGPILEEFRARRDELFTEQHDLYLKALAQREIPGTPPQLNIAVTAQGGVGTSNEQDFLLRHYNLESVGWGTPWLLVPEVMNVQEETMDLLSRAGVDDLYLSEVSPLGVPFNNVRNNTKDLEKEALVAAGKPGSPCVKKFLSLNSELSEKPICTASIIYLKKKIKDLRERFEDEDEYQEAYDAAVNKACLCEGLTISALAVKDIEMPKLSKAVSVCPGPNMAYFSRVASLRQMVDHIYGRLNIMSDPERPHMFLKELQLYVDYLHGMLKDQMENFSTRKASLFDTFHDNLMEGVRYYRTLIPEIREESEQMRHRMQEMLAQIEARLLALQPVTA